MKTPIYCSLALLLIMLFSCDNPFLPATGKPDKSFSPRSTPEGVLRQLFQSYESKRLDLYEELLCDSFQFYVAPSFISDYISEYNAKYPVESYDTSLTFITGSKFYYWTKVEEMVSHQKLFSDFDGKTKQIRFTSIPVLSSIRYITNPNADTVNIEMKVTGGELYIQVSTTGAIPQYTEYTIAIEEQVFLLQRDDENLWGIRKWYDLSNQ